MDHITQSVSLHGQNRRVYDIRSKRRLTSTGSGLDLSSFAFGYTLSGNTLSVNGGGLYIHGPAYYGSAAPTDITLQAGVQYIYVSFDADATGGLIARTTVMPTPAANTVIAPLYKFDGTALSVIYHTGDIHISTGLW